MTDATPRMNVVVPVDAPQHRAASAMRLEVAAMVLAACGGLIGVAVLVGYAVRNESIVTITPNLPPMYPNAAVGLAVGGVAVLASRRSGGWRVLAGAGGAVVELLGVVGLWLNVTEADRTWYESLFPLDFVHPTTPVGGRPVAETCVAFILLGASMLLLALRRGSVVAQALGVAGASVGLSATVGYLLGVDRTSLGGSLVYVGMALHTGLGIALVGLATVLVRPNVGFVAQLIAGGVGGAATRRVTLAVAAAPLVLVLMGVLLSHALPTAELSQSVFSVLQVGVLGAAVLIPASIITSTERELREQLDTARRQAEHRTDVDTLADAITDEMVVTVPDVPGWQFGMRYEPATGHIAGDSVQSLDRRHPAPATLVAIIDIAGHDAYAGLVAYGLRAHIAALWDHGADLAEIAASANAKLVRRATIATGVLLAFEHGADHLDVVNAGHPPPLHVRSGHVDTWERTGPLFGLDIGRHTVRRVEVQHDDVVVVWTDGLTEARSPDGEQLGEARLRRLVVTRRTATAQEIADTCVDLAVDHSGARLRDDAAVVTARRLR